MKVVQNVLGTARCLEVLSPTDEQPAVFVKLHNFARAATFIMQPIFLFIGHEVSCAVLLDVVQNKHGTM